MFHLMWLLIVAGTLDLTSTYFATPDLTREANPVVTVMGRSWSNLILLKASISLGALALSLVGFRILDHRTHLFTDRSTFTTILGILFFRERVSLGRLLFGWPRDWAAVGAVGTLTVCTVPILGGFAAAITNTLGLIRSPTHLILFWCLIGLAGSQIAIYLACQYVGQSTFNEQD